MRLRVEVLALVVLDPPLGNTEIARRCAAKLGRRVRESTVRGIISRFGASDDPLLRDSQRSGRAPKYGKRIKRCELKIRNFCSFISPLSSIVALARKQPKWSAKRLVNEVHAKVLASLSARPAGAVVRVPGKPSPRQVRRYLL